jgi:hypothetical protein
MSEGTNIVDLAFDLICQSVGGLTYAVGLWGGGGVVLCKSCFSNNVQCIEMKCEE